MVEFGKVLSDYITTHNTKIDLYFINREFQIEFDNNFSANLEIIYHYITDTNNINSYLLYYIDSCKSGGYKFSKINNVILNRISYICNMKYKYYINQPMRSVERRIKMIIAKSPQLINALDRNKNQPLIRKYSHMPFIN